MRCEILVALACGVLLARPVAALDPDSFESRLARIEALGPAEKEELRNKKDRFERLPAGEQERLRHLHDEIARQPDADKLLRIMVRYGDWLKSLPINQRAELASLEPSQRLKAIKKSLEQQERQRFQELVYRKLNPKDYEVIINWLSSLVKRTVDSLEGKLPPEAIQELAQKQDPVDAMFEITRLRREHLKENNLRPLDMIEVSDADIAALSSQLSPEARGTLAEATNRNDKLTAVKYWILAATVSRRLHRVSDDELKQYLETRVDATTRDYLQNLPREQMLNQLRRMYSMDRYRPKEGDSGRRSFRGWGTGEGWPFWPGWPPGRPGPPPGPPDPKNAPGLILPPKKD